MTAIEAAKRLEVSYDFLLRLLRQGLIKAKKRGREWVVDGRSVEDRLRKVA